MSQDSSWDSIQVKDFALKSRHSFIDGDWIEAPYITNAGIRLIQTGNIGIGCFVNKNKKYISDDAFTALKCKEVFPGDILICRLADPIGRSCICPKLNKRAITSVDVCILRVASEKYDRDFIAHALNQRSFLEACQEKSGGSTRQRISRTNLGSIELNVPLDKPVQAKIAEILSTVDLAIEQTEAAIAKQQRIKTGLMQDLLTCGIDEQGNLRSTHTHQFKDSPLGRIPVEWEVKTLKDVSCGGAQNGFFKKPELVGSGFKLINVSEIYQPFGIDTNQKDVERVSATQDDFIKYGVSEGDLFFTRSSLVLSGIAHCNIIRAINEPTVFECHVMRIRPDKSTIVPEFLALFCQSNVARLFLMSRAKHVTMATISQPELEALKIPVPPTIEEQLAIVDAVLESEKSARRAENTRNKLQRLKVALMQDLLTGKRRVSML